MVLRLVIGLFYYIIKFLRRSIYCLFVSWVSRRLVFGTRLNMPSKRSGHVSCSSGPFVIFYGGFSGFEDEFCYYELLIYNTVTKKWRHLKVPRWVDILPLSSRMVIKDKILYLYGGTGYPFSLVIGDTMVSYDIINKKWSNHSRSITVDCPGVYGHSMSLLGDDIYIYGGTYGLHNSDRLLTYSISTGIWACLKPENNGPGRVYSHNSFVYHKKLFIIGGIDEAGGFAPFTKAFCYSPLENAWSKVLIRGKNGFNIDHPRKRGKFTSALVGNYLYISGGTDEISCFCDVWRLNLKRMFWEPLVQNLWTPLYFHAMSFSVDGSLIIFGGVDEATDARTNKLQCIQVMPMKLNQRCLQIITRNKNFEKKAMNSANSVIRTQIKSLKQLKYITSDVKF